jgi:ATP-dependent Clp protease ATP-binding subunit ClpA
MEFLLDEGTSDVFGARELNRVIDRYVGFPIASLIASEQLVHGDTVKVDKIAGDEDFRFLKQEKV